MKKFFPSILALAVLSGCASTTSYQTAYANRNPSLELFENERAGFGCDSLTFYLSDHILGSYKEEVQFPNPPKTVYLGGGELNEMQTFKIECPALSASYDGNVITLKSNDYMSIWKRVGVVSGIPFYSAFGYKYPSIKVDPWSASLNFDPITFQVFTNSERTYVIEEQKTSAFSSYKDVVIGYKVDGGTLQPLLYDGKLQDNYQDVLRKANVIQLFYKSSASYRKPNYESIYINKPNGLIKIYREHPFPSE